MKVTKLNQNGDLAEVAELFKYTFKLLELYGHSWKDKAGPAVWFNRLRHSLIILLVFVILVPSWTIVGHLPNYSTMMCIFSALIGHYIICKWSIDIMRVLKSLISVMGEETRAKMARDDKRRLLMVVGFIVLLGVNNVTSYIVSDSYGFTKIMVNYTLPFDDPHHLFDGAVFVILHYALSAELVMVLFYSIAFQVLKNHALVLQQTASLAAMKVDQPEACCDYLATFGSLYTIHANAKEQMNLRLGAIPLLVFGSLFTYYVAGVSYIVINTESLSFLFKLTFIVPSTIAYTFLAYLLSFRAGGATQALDAANKAAIAVIAKCPYLSANGRLNYERDALYKLITAQGSVPATACGLFNVDSSLMLSFANSVVPFTVMIITSFADFMK